MGEDIFWKIADALGLVGLPIVGWFMTSHQNRLQRIEDENSVTRHELATFQLDAEKRFAREESVQLSLSRVHGRLDDISTDIKTLISKVGR